MPSEFRLPALGADMDEGTIVEWHVAPGARVKRGDVVAVVAEGHPEPCDLRFKDLTVRVAGS